MILLQIEEWFHSGLAGIRQAPGSVGYRRLVIAPRLVGDLTRVDSHYQTPYGEVTVQWVRKGGVFQMRLELPPNTTAEVRMPTGGDAARVIAGDATLMRVDGDRAVYSVPAGSYMFTARTRARHCNPYTAVPRYSRREHDVGGRSSKVRIAMSL